MWDYKKKYINTLLIIQFWNVMWKKAFLAHFILCMCENNREWNTNVIISVIELIRFLNTIIVFFKMFYNPGVHTVLKSTSPNFVCFKVPWVIFYRSFLYNSFWSLHRRRGFERQVCRKTFSPVLFKIYLKLRYNILTEWMWGMRK